MFQYLFASAILCSVGEVITFEHAFHISAFDHIRMLILSIYFLVACINTFYKFQYFGSGALYLRFETC